MPSIVEVLHKVAPKCQKVYVDAFAAGGDLLNEYGIATPLRQAHLLAQFLGETGGGTLLQESGNYSAQRIVEVFGPGVHSAKVGPAEAAKLAGDGPALFERVYGRGNPSKAHELGNLKPGDGWTFRGTGPLQSTGRGAAKLWGDRCGVSFVDNVLLMVDPRYVLKPMLFEWKAGGLNDYADRNDLAHIRRYINGGYNGLEGCRDWFDKVWPPLREGAAEAWQAASTDSTTKQIQIMLNQIGYEPALKADGRLGPQSTDAVRWFQKLNGLKADGVAGVVTVQTLRLRLQAYHVADAA